MEAEINESLSDPVVEQLIVPGMLAGIVRYFNRKKMLLKTVHFQYIAPLKNDDFGPNKGYPPSDLF